MSLVEVFGLWSGSLCTSAKWALTHQEKQEKSSVRGFQKHFFSTSSSGKG